MRWQWHQLDHMQINCSSLQRDNHASTTSLIFFDALPEQCQSTEGKVTLLAEGETTVQLQTEVQIKYISTNTTHTGICCVTWKIY